MKVETANPSGFCFGVDKAVRTVGETIEENAGVPIYTYGPIIHNESVVNELAGTGARAVSEDEIDSIEPGIMIIRSHGVSKAVVEDLEKKGHKVVDATCPFVKRIHRIVDKESSEGKTVLIVGNPNHPEVQGIKGWCNSEPLIIETVEDVDGLNVERDREICVVSQTTFNYKKFENIVEKLEKLGYYINVVNTICNATEERQQAAAMLAKKADCMIVIGGSRSSNSRKLFEICENECKDTYFIQTLDDLHLDITKSVGLVGITAGASTPNNIIEEVQNYVRNEF